MVETVAATQPGSAVLSFAQPPIGSPVKGSRQLCCKLGEILAANDIKSVTLARMQVPCCGGLEHALQRAIAATGKKIPLRVFVVAN